MKSRLLLCIPMLLSLTTSSRADVGDEHWSYEFGWPGSLEYVFAVRQHEGRLYYGGGGTSTNTPLFVFDGSRLTRLGLFSGGFGTSIYDMAFVGNHLYVGGLFTNVDGVTARGLARWDGQSWSSVGVTNGTVFALATDGASLYAGGGFSNPGGVALTNVGRWTGSAWQAMGASIGATNTDAVRALLVTNGVIYAAGTFSSSGSQSLTNIAQWTGGGWVPIGGGIPGSAVYGLAWKGSSLFAAGLFSQAGGVPANNIAQWDGANWSALGSGVAGTVASIDVLNNLVCVAGAFNSAGGTAITNFAVWNGSTWSSGGANPSASCLEVYSSGTNLYLGGNFLAAGGGVMAGLAAWDGTGWSPVGPPDRIAGLHTSARAIVSDGTNLFVGGDFLYAGNTNAARIGRYDGSRWHTIGNGLNDTVRQLALVGTNLYAAGDFSGSPGGSLALRLARWNGAQWLALNNTAFNNISSLAVRSNDLFVGGFSGITAANGTASATARWDGTNFWNYLVFDSYTFVAFPFPATNISCIGIQGTNIYLAGNFFISVCDSDLQNCVSSSNVMRFDGTYGRALNGGLSGPASAIASIGTNIYFAGTITNAGGITVNRIACYNGQSWSQVGGAGVVGNGTISTLAVIGTNLYAGGSFTNINGVRALHIAKWNGFTWSALGSGTLFTGTAGPVLGLHAVGQDLYVGGTFRTAGGKPAYYLARWNESTAFDPVVLQFSAPSKSFGGPFQAMLTASSPSAAYVIESSPDLLNWTPVLTNTGSPFQLVDPTAGPRRFYRAYPSP